MIEQFLADDYAIERRLPDSGFGKERYLVSRTSGENAGGIYVLDFTPHLYPLTNALLERQRKLAEKMANPPGEAFCPVVKTEFHAERQCVLSVDPGPLSLHEVLRQRQAITAPQATQVLAQLIRAVEAAIPFGWPRVSTDAKHIYLHPAVETLRLPAPEIPTYYNAAHETAASGSGTGGGITDSTAIDPMQTITFSTQPNRAMDGQGIPKASRDYVPALSQLVCDLLGQPRLRSVEGNVRFQPVPSLSSSENRALRTALLPGARQPHRSAAEFFQSFSGIPLDEYPLESLSDLIVEPTPIAVPTGPSILSQPSTEPAPPPLPQAEPAAPEPTPEVAPAPASGHTDEIPLPAGYHLERELVSNQFVRVCHARDPSGESALLTILAPKTTGRIDTTSLGSCLYELQQLQSDNLLPIHETRAGNPLTFVARIIKSGINLGEVVRRQSRLTKEQVSLVLLGLYHAYLDFWKVESTIVASSLTQIILTPSPPASNVWQPGVSVKLDGGEALLIGTRFQEEPMLRRHFAIIACQLFGQPGGELTSLSSIRFTPVPELSADDNGLLRELADADSPDAISLEEFLTRFTGIKIAPRGESAEDSTDNIPVTGPLRIAESYRDRTEAVPCTGLRLMPATSGIPILSFVAGDEPLILGRSAKDADFVAQYSPRSNTNDARTRMISRCQLEIHRVEGEPDQFKIKDTGSQNPSLLDDSKTVDTRKIRPPFSLLLGGEYAVRVKSYPSRYEKLREFDNSVRITQAGEEENSVCGPTLIVRGMESQILRFDTAWLTSDIELVADNNGVLRLGQSQGNDIAARVHYWHEEFWIEGTPGDFRLRIDETDLAAHELAPLRPGARLDFNGIRYIAKRGPNSV